MLLRKGIVRMEAAIEKLINLANSSPLHYKHAAGIINGGIRESSCNFLLNDRVIVNDGVTGYCGLR